MFCCLIGYYLFRWSYFSKMHHLKRFLVSWCCCGASLWSFYLLEFERLSEDQHSYNLQLTTHTDKSPNTAIPLYNTSVSLIKTTQQN